MTPMALDIFIGIIILLSTIVAYLRGIIKETFTLLALLLGSFLAYKAGHLLMPVFDSLLSVPEDGVSKKADYVLFGVLSPAMASKTLSFGSIFGLTFVFVTLVGMFLTRWMMEIGVAFVDGFLGAMFGFVRGFLLVFLFYVPFTYLIDTDKMPDWVQESYSVAALQSTFDWANEKFDIDEKIKEGGNGITIKFNKIDPRDIGKDKEDLKSKMDEVTDVIQDTVSDSEEMIKSTVKEVEVKIMGDDGEMVVEEKMEPLKEEEKKADVPVDPFSEAYFADDNEEVTTDIREDDGQ